MIKKLLRTITGVSPEDHRADIYRDLIRHEARIGGTLFGPLPKGGRREFFCLDERTWVWHEEWIDKATHQTKSKTTRYDVRPDGILKAQEGQGYRYVSVQEARHLYEAAKIYNQRVRAELYNFG